MKLYLVALGSGFNREEVVKYLETLPSTGTWFYSMPYSFFISSSASARELSDLLKAKFPGDQLRHFVAQVGNGEYQGWMPKDHWDVFNRVVR
jgi:hypothetical protein